MREHIEVLPDKCLACRLCEVACIAAHHGMTVKDAMKRRNEFTARVAVVKTEDGLKTSLRCHQCDDAPCAHVCPTGALQLTEKDILVRPEFCIACKMCISVCPYGAIALERQADVPAVQEEGAAVPAPRCPHREVAVRCDVCVEWRAENGKEVPACMEACKARAITLVEPDGRVIVLPPPPKKEKAEGGKPEGKPEGEKAEGAEKPAPAAEAGKGEKPAKGGKGEKKSG
ncbi:MAG: 4Fe-4S binding protein [Desulfovibrio sp.]|jgi:carbon-monoxide dehydrogenase iron sulfur subunit|nr:4Fe-4S binding protein [Desulfovibrio sp.]